MNPVFRRILAIVGLVLAVPFVVFLIMALGMAELPGNLAPVLASVFGLAVLIIFLTLKFDADRTKKMNEVRQAELDARLKEGAERLDAEIEAGTARECEETADDADGRGE